MIVATAGHIDHGKTSLVKALTGVDTDRLPQEKARGISIDLGFAYCDGPRGADGSCSTIGFVDVPGHERFVRNMLAGVAAVDFALLVIAADDGVMPQTREHLAILDLLQIRAGLVAITKCDRVAASRIDAVEVAVRQLLAGSTMAGSPIFRVSVSTGLGLPTLREALLRAASAHRRAVEPGRRFRFAIDRAFVVGGSGTVATGTVFAGTATSGERLVLSPSGREVRVRAIQHNGRATDRAIAGERCALNLVGIEVSQVARGDWVVDAALHSPTRRVDVDLRLLGSEAHELRHWTGAHIHIGTSDVTGHVALSGGTSLQPGELGHAQLVLDKPVAALRGDRFVVRDQSAMRTIGGGVVIDHLAPGRVRNRELRGRYLSALRRIQPSECLVELARHSPSGVDVSHFEIEFGLTRERVDTLIEEHGLLSFGKAPRMAFSRSRLDELGRTITTALGNFHAVNAQAPGMEVSELRRRAAPSVAAAMFHDLLRHLAADLCVEISGSIARLRRHIDTANPADERTWQHIVPLLEDAALAGLTISELAQAAGIKEGMLKDFMHRKARTGQLVPVTPGRFYLRRTLAQAAAVAFSVAQTQPDGRFTAAQFRDRTPLGRTRAIELLECLDRLGVTRRVGDTRIVHQDYVPILGPAGPRAADSVGSDRRVPCGTTRQVRHAVTSHATHTTSNARG